MTPALQTLLVALAVFAGVMFAAGTTFTIVGIQRWSPRWHWAASVLFTAGMVAVAVVVVVGDAPPLASAVVGDFVVLAVGNVWLAFTTGREAGR